MVYNLTYILYLQNINQNKGGIVVFYLLDTSNKLFSLGRIENKRKCNGTLDISSM